MDLKAFASDVPPIVKYLGLDRFLRLLRLLRHLGKPVMRVANGDVYAGAFGIIHGRDLVIAKESARFACPEINVGVFPLMVSAIMFRSVPRLKGNEVMTLGQAITAREALELGVVNWVVMDASFQVELAVVVRKLVDKSPLWVQLGKMPL